MNGAKSVLRSKSLAYYVQRFQSQQSYVHNVGGAPLLYRTIGQQLSLSAEKYHDRIFAITNHEKGTSRNRLTYGQLKEKADQLAAGFLELGLQKGDRVGVWSPNCSSWYITMFAAARLGLVTVGLNPEYKAREVEYCLKKANVKVLITTEGYNAQNYYGMLNEIIPELSDSNLGDLRSKTVPSLKSVIVDANRKFHGTFSFDDILSLSTSKSTDIDDLQSQIKPDGISTIQFTSGTTGLPKATLLSHFSIVNNAFAIGKRSELDSRHHTILAQLPFFSSFGNVIQLMSSLIYGATIVMPDKSFNPLNTLRAIEKRKCTIMFGTPKMYTELMRTVQEANKQFGEAWETAVLGGAFSSPQLLQDLKTKFGLKSVYSMYGLTEATAVIFQSQPTDDHNRLVNTVGKVHDHLEIKVTDRDGNTIPFGQPGELWVRGYTTLREYFREEDKTKEILDESKWLRTGDKFVLTADGYGRIVGRVRDIVKRGGEFIFPKDIEDFLRTHTDILEAYVVGVPDERMGEEICAFIRVVEGKHLRLEDITAFCKGKLEENQIPRYVRIIKDFPTTTSGKIQKYKLREQFRTSICF